MRKALFLAVPFVLLVAFFAFLRALDQNMEARAPAVRTLPPPPHPTVDLLKLVDLDSTGDLYFGQNGEGGEWYKGELRDVAVWDRGLVESEIRHWPPPGKAAGFWPLNGDLFPSAPDASGNRNAGRIIGGTLRMSDASGKALSLDGSTGFVRVPRSERLESPAVSVSCWLRRSAAQGDWANLVRKTWLNNSGPTFMSWSLQLNPNGKGSGILAFNTGSRDGYHTLLAPEAIPEGRWTHVVGVYDPASPAPQKRLYVDGRLAASGQEDQPLRFDSVHNQWKFDGAVLVSPQEHDSPSRAAISAVVPEEYDLTVGAVRRRGGEALHLGLRCGSSECVLVIDALEDGEYRSGIDLVDGKSFRDNPTTIVRKLIRNNSPFTLTVKVRRREIRVLLDGAPLLVWEGDPAKLSTSPFFRFPKAGALYVGVWESCYAVSRLALDPVTSSPGGGR